MPFTPRRVGDPEAKRCTQCGYLQIIEAFPIQGRSNPVSGFRRRHSWCVECLRDRSRDGHKART